MNASVLWKLLLTALLLVFSFTALTPLTTREFSSFAASEVTADKPGFDKLLAEARVLVQNHVDEAVDKPKAPTIYQAIRDIANDPANPIDLQKTFFPELKLIPEPNLAKRNILVMRHLLAESQGKLKLGLDLQGGVAFKLRIPAEAFEGKDADARHGQLERAIKVMEDRINQYGVAEPLIRTLGDDTIEIQLPGADMANNPDALDALKKPAKLEFRMVHRELTPSPGEAEHSVKRLREFTKELASPTYEYEVLIQRVTNPKTGEVAETPYYVSTESVATGKIIKKAGYNTDQSGLSWHTSIDFNDEGSKIFEKLTGKIAEENNRFRNANGRMAIILDGKLVSAPGIKASKDGTYSAIAGGSASIDADNRAAAAELANVLNNPLDVPLELLDVQSIGPSLAAEAQTKSVTAAAVGIGLVVVFMVAFYLFAGVLSVVAVVANVIMILGVLAAIGGTITLPGVAALVLTVGMAVDMNILVFERMREESRKGASIKQTLSAGYSRALATILDANITTLLIAVILIWMGTGAVRGFGVTLAIGILTTVFTALITTRGLQELFVNLGLFTKVFGVTILKKETHIPFLSYTRKAACLACAVLLLGAVALGARGKSVLGKDFTGGESVTVEVVQGKKLEVNEIARIATAAGVPDTTAVYIEDISGKKSSLRIETPLTAAPAAANPDAKVGETRVEQFGNSMAVVTALVAEHPDYFTEGKSAERLVTGREAIGASVSSSLQWNAIISVLVALFGIGIYVTLRFETGFGVGAMVSTLHDVLVTVGLYIAYGWFFGGGQANAAMVASILMIIGYSINDTIIIFDRIREEMADNPKATLRECIELAINRTLSRTILTSVTVFLTAVALFVFGAGDVKEYGLVFCFGVLTGVFSSIFIACPIFYWWHKGERSSVEKAESTEKRAWELDSTAKPAPGARNADAETMPESL